MSKKDTVKIKDTAPTIFKMPYGRMSYFLIEDPRQLAKLEKSYKGKQIQKLVPNSNDFRAITWYMTHDKHGIMIGVYFPDMTIEENVNDVLATLVHECTHVWQFFHKDAIAEHNPSDEFEAYAVADIFKNVLGEFDRLCKIRDEMIAKVKPKTALAA